MSYVFSSTKLEKRAKQFCPEVGGVWFEGGTNNVYLYNYM
jgi:hypothetical protein